jgi:hypothetical protein
MELGCVGGDGTFRRRSKVISSRWRDQIADEEGEGEGGASATMAGMAWT